MSPSSASAFPATYVGMSVLMTVDYQGEKEVSEAKAEDEGIKRGIGLDDGKSEQVGGVIEIVREGIRGAVAEGKERMREKLRDNLHQLQSMGAGGERDIIEEKGCASGK